MLGVEAAEQIFFSPQTDLSDLLGQFRPRGSEFVWEDGPLLRGVKQGGVVALVDLNLAPQQVIEGVNSLFDHRGSIFVVELNQEFRKAESFSPVVLLRRDKGQGRKGLPNSFLNRFVKLAIPDVPVSTKIDYLTRRFDCLKR